MGGFKIYPNDEKNINIPMATKLSQLNNDSGYAKLINMSQNNNFSDSYVGKAKFAFQEEESLAIGKNATVKANVGDVAIGANTSTNERYDVNINNELLHNVEENIWEGKITEASRAYTNENGTNLTQLDVVIENLATEIENRKNADETLRNNINTEIQNRTDADTNLSNRITHIEDLLPNQVSSSNQLADKAFVNSSIQTNTANFLGNKVNYGFTTMVDLGFTKDSYVSVRDFWAKIYTKYSKGNGVIQFIWNNSKSAYLGTSTNYATINDGTLIYTCGSPNSTWSGFNAIYVSGNGDDNNVYQIHAHISDNITAGAEKWGIYTLTNTKYVNDKLKSPLPWKYNYMSSGYSSSLHYRKIGEGYFKYTNNINWSFYSEIEILYHRPSIWERGTIYIDMRGNGSNVRVMHVRYQYKNGTSIIRLLSNTKVNYKVDTTNKRVYLELLAYCDDSYTMILFRNSLTRTGEMLLTENPFWTFAPTGSYVQSSDTMQAGITDGYTEIPMTAFDTKSYIENHTLVL